MRYLELALYILMIFVVIYSWVMSSSKKKSKWAKIWFVVAAALLIAHGWFEGLTFVYGVVCVGMIVFIIQDIILKHKLRSNETPSTMVKVLRNLCFIVSFLLMILTGILLWLFPVNHIPVPTGPYDIGTVTYELTDTKRSEIYGDQPGEPRKIRFQVWYPADNIDGGELTKWMTDGKVVASGVPNMYGLPLFALDHTGLIDSNSYSGVPISDSETNYPVVIISHGWTGFMNLHTDIAEMLASHGYIVVSINHTYGAAVSVFDDGSVVYADLDALPDRDAVDNFDDYSHALVNTYALDDQLVLDYLENYPIDTGVLEDRMDMNRIGLLGHSTGGGGVVQTAIGDDRVKAVFGLDAWVEPVDESILSIGLSVPSLFMRSEQWVVGPNNQYLKTLVDVSGVTPMVYQIEGCNHLDLTMLYMYNPITRLFGFSGELDNLENASIQRDYILTFFDEMLLGEDVDASELVETYDAVEIVKDYEVD
jgi:hypothetical protein